MKPAQDVVVANGHLIDSGILSRILDTVVQRGGEFEVLEFEMGRTNEDSSRLRLRIAADSPEALSSLQRALHEVGCTREEIPPLVTEHAPADGIAPRAFYSTTNHPTEILLDGDWRRVRDQRMDASIVVSGGEGRCTKLRDIRRGDRVVCGHAGVRVLPPPPERDRADFAFMSNEVSSERKVRLLVAKLASEMTAIRARGGRVVVVAGPVVVHTGGSDDLGALIRAGHVQALLAGNALAVHDLEDALFGTSLGVSTTSGLAIEGGHHHHIHTINRVNAAGGIESAVASGLVKSGVMYECVKSGVKFVLAGSLRDDGPLLETITDMNRAQDAYANELVATELVLILSSMLHGIAVGNMLPSSVRTVCVDIHPAVVTKLADRGTAHAVGIVTDVGLFLHLLAQELGAVSEAGSPAA